MINNNFEKKKNKVQFKKRYKQPNTKTIQLFKNKPMF